MRLTAVPSVVRSRVSLVDNGTMPTSAMAMKSRPRPAFRAAAIRSVASESLTGRAIPRRSPDPDLSWVVTITQSLRRAVAGPSAFATSPNAATRDLSASVRV